MWTVDPVWWCHEQSSKTPFKKEIRKSALGVVLIGRLPGPDQKKYSASSLVCHLCYTFYSNYGRSAWFMTPYSADLPEIYYTGLLHLTLYV